MKLVFATHNAHKVAEAGQLLPKTTTLLSLNDIGCFEEIPETGATLEENAQIKANYVMERYGYPCFADDTGLLVDALDGAPGVYSARYAGEPPSSRANIIKLLAALKGQTNREASFKTVISLNLGTSQVLFTGEVIGHITEEPLGGQGFGYDPIFRPNGHDRTFAQLPLSVKNEIGHRGKAMRALVQYLSQYHTDHPH